MRLTLLVAIFAAGVFCANQCDGQLFQRFRQRQPMMQNNGSLQALAQQKANKTAQLDIRGKHLGGYAGQRRFVIETTGWSRNSAQESINASCHSGHPISAKGPGLPVVAQYTVRGQNGIWYTVGYVRRR